MIVGKIPNDILHIQSENVKGKVRSPKGTKEGIFPSEEKRILPTQGIHTIPYERNHTPPLLTFSLICIKLHNTLLP